MHSAHALALLLCAFPITGSGLQTGSTASKSLLVGLTTGAGAELTSEVVTLDPTDGTTVRVGALVLPKGHGRVQSQDVVWSADGKQLLVAQLEFVGKDDEPKTWLDLVDPAKLEVVRSGPSIAGVIDSLCWDGQGRLLSTHGNSRPQKLNVLDPQTGTSTELGALDAKLWVRSLVWRAKESELWALHTRTNEMPTDALVRLSPQNGAILQTVELRMDEMATALALDARGGFVVTGDKEGLFAVDLATGKTKRAKKETGVLVTGMVLGR